MQLAPAINAVHLLSQADGVKVEKAPMSRELMEEVGTEFESVFASMLIKQMRESAASGLFEGDGSDSYGAMFDMFIGQHMAEAGGLGIKQMLVQRYTANLPSSSPTESKAKLAESTVGSPLP